MAAGVKERSAKKALQWVAPVVYDAESVTSALEASIGGNLATIYWGRCELACTDKLRCHKVRLTCVAFAGNFEDELRGIAASVCGGPLVIRAPAA